MKAYYYGDLRLWKTGLRHEREAQRRFSMTFDGVDQDDALVIASGGSWLRGITAFTFFDQHPTYPYTQKGFRALVGDMDEALIERSATLHPLCYVLNDAAVPNVLSYLVGVLTTTAAHGLIVGDVILIRRLGADLYTLATVATTPAANTMTLSTASHAIAAGDNILLCEGVWPECRYMSMTSPGKSSGGDYFGEEVPYRFDVGDPANIYLRTTVDLDA